MNGSSPISDCWTQDAKTTPYQSNWVRIPHQHSTPLLRLRGGERGKKERKLIKENRKGSTKEKESGR